MFFQYVNEHFTMSTIANDDLKFFASNSDKMDLESDTNMDYSSNIDVCRMTVES